MHSLLARQIRKFFGASMPAGVEFQNFLAAVGQAYEQSDRDRALMERSLDLSSAELYRANAEMRAVFDAIPDVFFRLDAEGRILEHRGDRTRDGDPSAEKILGKRFGEVSAFAPADQFEPAMCKVQECRQPVSVEYSLTTGGMLEFYEARLLPLPENEVVVIVRNISERKRAEKQLRQAKAEADRANAAKSEFLSRMSHELRTPMNAILGFAQLLEMDVVAPEQRDAIEQILKGGRHLLELINEVLDLSRIESGRLSISVEPVHLKTVVEDCLQLLRPIATQRRITLRSTIGGDQYVMADSQRLKQVVLNLLSNAVKFNRDGGTATLGTERTAADRLRIKIEDTGTGIRSDDFPRLFGAFQRLDADRLGIEGSGLGLALSKRLIELMGGQIGVESVVGAGSTFWVELPLAESPVRHHERLAETEVEAGALPPPERTILSIEDNLANQQLIARIFARSPGTRLLSAIKGSLGLELAREHRPGLILLDLQLPDINGDRVLAMLKGDARTADIPVIMVSADATKGQIERLLAAGAHAYLTKPFSIQQMMETIDEAMKSSDTA